VHFLQEWWVSTNKSLWLWHSAISTIFVLDDDFDLPDLLSNKLVMDASDELNVINAGGVEVDNNTERIIELLDSGEHFDDVTTAELESTHNRSE
jgi:hypothetical protein